jgi:hypothetical protein
VRQSWSNGAGFLSSAKNRKWSHYPAHDRYGGKDNSARNFGSHADWIYVSVVTWASSARFNVAVAPRAKSVDGVSLQVRLNDPLCLPTRLACIFQGADISRHRLSAVSPKHLLRAVSASNAVLAAHVWNSLSGKPLPSTQSMATQ